MATWLKQSTAVEIAMGPFVDATDFATVEDSLTLSQADVRLKKNGGDWAQKNESTAMAHEENGWYRCLLDATDTNTLGILVVNVAESGALQVWREFMVVPANEYDSLISGTDALDVEVASMAAGTVTAAAIATDAIDDDAIATGAIASTAFAASAITAAALATDAVNEIVDQVWREAIADHEGTAGSTAETLFDLSAGSTPAGIAAEVWGTVITELSSPPDMATATVGDILEWLGMLAANRRTQTTGSEVVYKSDGTTSAGTSTKTDVSGTFTRGEYS